MLCIDNFEQCEKLQIYYNETLSSRFMSSSILFPTNEYTSSSKSSEEIQKLIIPDEIQETQVFSYLLNKNHPLQMPFVYKYFHKHPEGIISLICQKAVGQNPDNQIIICSSLKIILEKQKILSINELDSIYKMTVQCLNNLNSIANEPLGQILEILLKVHPKREDVINKLQSEILQLGKVNQPTISKVTSGRLISIISKHIGKLLMKGQMIDILKRVLTNNEIEARKVWVQQIFPKLLQRLQLDFVQLHLQQKIYECVYDQNEEIGVMALKVILKNITKFSIEEQSSRIVKLFLDSLTSKNEKVCVMVTEIMGEVYEKLINIIMKTESSCTKFWRSLVELAQCKHQKILNNLIYNLPGILLLSSKFHKTDPLVEVYCELFYEPLTNKIILMSFFHQIVFLYPHKKEQLKQIVYWIFGELFEEEEQDYDIEAIKIINSFIRNLSKSKNVFLSSKDSKENIPSHQSYHEIPTITSRNSLNTLVISSQKTLSTNHAKITHNPFETIVHSSHQQFQIQFCQYLLKFLHLLQFHKNSQWFDLFYTSIKQVAEFLPLEFIQKSLLPKIYSSIKTKGGPIELMMQIIVLFLKKDICNIMNFYTSKIHVQFSKSAKSHERQAVIQFLYYCSIYFSIQTFQEYKLGEKFLYFSNDKFYSNRFLFIKYLARIQYFLTRQQKVEMGIILSRLMKENDSEMTQMILQVDLSEKEDIKLAIYNQSKVLKQIEKLQTYQPQYSQPNKSLKPLVNNHRRESKEIKKEDILKKRIETNKSKTKMLIKEIPKKKNLNLSSISSATTKTHQNLKKNS